MVETKTPQKKKSPLLFVGVACLVLIVLMSIGSAVVGKFFAKKIVQGVVEKGKVTFTDAKTGAKVDIGSGKVPDTFPKDFPLYPGAKVVSAMSGNESGKNNGFWLTMTTTDSLAKVEAFYKTQFTAGGWTVSSTFTTGGTTSETVEKGQWSGSLAISEDSSSKETQIVIILGQKEQ
jgi:hypothetical protein